MGDRFSVSSVPGFSDHFLVQELFSEVESKALPSINFDRGQLDTTRNNGGTAAAALGYLAKQLGGKSRESQILPLQQVFDTGVARRSCLFADSQFDLMVSMGRPFSLKVESVQSPVRSSDDAMSGALYKRSFDQLTDGHYVIRLINANDEASCRSYGLIIRNLQGALFDPARGFFAPLGSGDLAKACHQYRHNRMRIFKVS